MCTNSILKVTSKHQLVDKYMIIKVFPDDVWETSRVEMFKSAFILIVSEVRSCRMPTISICLAIDHSSSLWVNIFYTYLCECFHTFLQKDVIHLIELFLVPKLLNWET